MPNIPEIKIGGITYNLKDAELRRDYTMLDNAATSLNGAMSAFVNRQYIDGTFSLVANSFGHKIYNPVNATYTQRLYRIASITPFQYPYPIKLICNNGFKMHIYRNNEGVWSGEWITSSVLIAQNESFYIQIARVTEDITENADITEFLEGISVERSTADRVLLKYMADNVTDDGAYISDQISSLYANGYRNFMLNANGTANIKTPLVIPSDCTLDGNGVTLKSANIAINEQEITPSRIISMINTDRVNLLNIRFEGSRTDGTAPAIGTPNNLIYLFNCNNIRIENCSIINYDTSIDPSLSPDAGYDGFSHSRAELWSAIVACGCSHLSLNNLRISKSNRELITLSRCYDFLIDTLWAYENDQYDVVSGQNDEVENRTYRAYSVLNLFDCYRGKLDKLNINHVSKTSAINFFTSYTTLSNSYIYGSHPNTTGIDLGNEIAANHYYTDNIICNNIIRCPIRRVGVAEYGYGFNRLLLIGNQIDLSHYTTAAEYAMSIPTGEVWILNNIIRGGKDNSSAAPAFHVANSWGRKIIIGNYIFGSSGFEMAPRAGAYQSDALPGDKEEIIIFGNVFSHHMVSISNFSNIDGDTRINIKLDNNISINGSIVHVTKVPDEKASVFTSETVQISVNGGRSAMNSIVRSGITLSVIGHECTSNDYFLSCDAELTNLRIKNTSCDSGTLLHIYSSYEDNTHGNINGNVSFCSAKLIVDVDTGCTDSTTKNYNVETEVVTNPTLE